MENNKNISTYIDELILNIYKINIDNKSGQCKYIENKIKNVPTKDIYLYILDKYEDNIEIYNIINLVKTDRCSLICILQEFLLDNYLSEEL